MVGVKFFMVECVFVFGDNDWSNMEKYVIYNWGKMGSDVIQTMLGWVSVGNDANCGCMFQNGLVCLVDKGWNY